MMKKIRLLGKYDYRNLIILSLSLVLFPLGLLSSLINTIHLTRGLFTFHNIYFSITSTTVLICFLIYYGFILFKRQHKTLFVSVSFSAYAFLFYLISEKSYSMSYVLIFFSTMLLFFSFHNFRRSLIISLLYLWVNLFLFFNKIFSNNLNNVEFNTTSPGDYLIIAGLVLSGGLFLCIYIISNELYERTELQKQLAKNDMTDKEKQIVFLHLMNYDKEAICHKLHMDIKTYRVHKGNIKKKLMIFKELNRKNIRSKLFDAENDTKEGRPV